MEKGACGGVKKVDNKVRRENETDERETFIHTLKEVANSVDFLYSKVTAHWFSCSLALIMFGKAAPHFSQFHSIVLSGIGLDGLLL